METMDSLQVSESTQIQIISRDEIPPILENSKQTLGSSAAETREFLHHPVLKKFLSIDNACSFAWTKIEHHQCFPIRANDYKSIFIVYKGSAKLVGQITQKITAGDVLIIPPDFNYGFEDISQEGLAIFSLKYLNQEPANTDKSNSVYSLSLEGLLEHNEQRQKQTLENSFFTLLKSDTLNSAKKRAMFFNALQIFGDYFQTLLYTRQATCFDQKYKAIFLAHLLEEIGHDELFAARNNLEKVNDSILEATSAWFCNQMLVLDNIEKTVLVHLILEQCGYHYHTYAKDKVNMDMKSDYYQIHSENDEEHAEMSMEVLQNLHPNTYRRLHKILDDGWDMLNTMQNRVAFLVNTIA